MRFRANHRVAAHQVADVLDAVLPHLFGFAERPAHTHDCSVMRFDPCFPRRDPLLHLCASRLLGKRVPSCHTRAGFAAEEDGEKRLVRAHNVSFRSTVILLATNNGQPWTECSTQYPLTEVLVEGAGFAQLRAA